MFTREVPIVAMTANAFRENVERCFEASMQDHISKPLNTQEIMDILRRYQAPGS
jgi:CheY-like chemotaxis protein